MNPPTTPTTDTLSPAFAAALKSPGGAMISAPASWDSPAKNVSVVTADAAKTDYNNIQNFQTLESARIYQQNQINAANKVAADQKAAEAAAAASANSATTGLTGAITSATGALNGTTGSTTGAGTTPAKAGDTLTTASGNSYISTGNPTADVLAGNNADVSAQLKATQTKLATAGTTAGLSPEQQTQISSLSSQFDSLITQQTQTNAMDQGLNSMALGRSGADRYSPETSASVMNHVVSDGIAKIADLTSKKNAALAQMTSGFESDNVKAVQSAYDDWNKANDTLTANLKEINTVLSAAQKAQSDAAQQKIDNAKSMSTFIQNNATGNTPYIAFGGSIYYASGPNQGQAIDPSQFSTLGINTTNTEQITDQSAFDTTDTKNYKYYSQQMTAAGAKPVDFNTWMTQQKKAGASNTTIVTGGGNSTAAIDNVKAIIAAHPNDWPGAADAINQRLGSPGAATVYDSLLKIAYALPKVTDQLAGVVTKSISSGKPYTQADFVADAQSIQKDNPYADLSTIEAAMVKSGIPMPGKLSAADQAAAQTAQFLGVDPSTINSGQ
jgi:hypothetical protein